MQIRNKIINKIFFYILPVLLINTGCQKEDRALAGLKEYNILWTSQSENSLGSMPVGGNNIQLNAWCENNDILFYLGSTDSYMNNSQNPGKLGRVRISFSPNPFENIFLQELRLQESEIVISGDQGFELTLWVDIHHPVVHADMKSDIPLEATISYETWGLITEYTAENQILFYHRNPSGNEKLETMIREQKAEVFRKQITDPIRDLTSGGILYGRELIPAGQTSGSYMGTPFNGLKLQTQTPVKSLDLRITLRIAQDESIENWQNELEQVVQKTLHTSSTDRLQTLIWWKQFWQRSYIHIHPEEDSSLEKQDVTIDPVAAAWQTGRNYQLFRYLMGCSKNARHPVLFNGGIFNVDNTNGRLPEYRHWQECEFMAQNQRLVYWPLLKTGDSDILQPGMNMYRNMVGLQKARAIHYWGIEGTAYPEALNIYGLQGVYMDPEIMVDCFNRCPARLRTEYGHSGFIHLEYHYTSMLDFAYLLLEAARFGFEKLQDQMPVIENAVKFYDNYYQKRRLERCGNALTKEGKLELYPSSALELYAGANNPTDAVSGLQALVNGVLSFPVEKLTNEQYLYFKELSTRLPDIPLAEKEGKTVLPPAANWELEGDQPNMEFPQLYTLFPFEVYSFNDPGKLKIAENTWLYNSKASAQKNYICWFQGGIYTAHLGLTEEAKSYALKKFLHPVFADPETATPALRFPAFWSSPHFCHAPDMDHGGTAMTGLQDMLLQTPGEKIYLFPAWPPEWDVEFKLHAPYNTLVEGSLKKGKIDYKVTPESRKKDIVIMLSQTET